MSFESPASSTLRTGRSQRLAVRASSPWATQADTSVKRKGAKISLELVEQPYGMLEFEMKDPDGYAVGVGQEIT